MGDLGCGEGKLLEDLLSAGFARVVGVEWSDHRATAAQRRAAGACGEDQVTEVACADFLESDYQWPDVEAAVLVEVLEHLVTRQFSCLAEALLSRAYRIVVVTTPNADFLGFGGDAKRHS